MTHSLTLLPRATSPAQVIIKGNSQENFHARIGDPDVEALVAVFAQYSFGHVRTIDLSWNDITDKGCQALAGLLRASPKVIREPRVRNAGCIPALSFEVDWGVQRL